MFTVTSSLPLLGSGFQLLTFPLFCVPGLPRSQVPASITTSVRQNHSGYLTGSKSKLLYDWQPVSMSCCRAPTWDLRPDITSCRNVAVWKMRSYFCGMPSLKSTGLQFAVQSFNDPSRAEPLTIWDSLNLEGQVPVFISPQEQGGRVIPPGIGLPSRRLSRLAGLRWRYSNPPQHGGSGPHIYIYPSGTGWSSPQSKSRYDRRSVNQYILVRSPRDIRGVHQNEFQFDIRRCILKRNFWCYHWEGCMWSKVEGRSCFTTDGQPLTVRIRVRVTLRLTVSLGVEPTLWTFDQILLIFQVFGSGICCNVSVGRPLWREAGSVLCKSQFSHLSVCTFNIYIFVFHTFTIHIHIHIHTHTHTHTHTHIYIYIYI
jgi:hypothetical protein